MPAYGDSLKKEILGCVTHRRFLEKIKEKRAFFKALFQKINLIPWAGKDHCRMNRGCVFVRFVRVLVIRIAGFAQYPVPYLLHLSVS